MNSFENMFPFDNITNTISKPRAKSSVLKTQPFASTNLEEVKQIRENKLDKDRAKMKEFYDSRTRLKFKQLDHYKTKQEEYMEKMKENLDKSTDSEEELAKQNKASTERKRPNTHIEKRPEKPFPGPGQYNIAGEVDLRKGYFMGKPPEKNKNDAAIKHYPNYVLLKSDIELMMMKTHTTFTSNKRFERFQPIKPSYEPMDEEERKREEENKKLSKEKHNNNLKRNDKFDRDQQYKRTLKDKRKENMDKRLKDLINKTDNNPKDANPGPGCYNPYYNDYVPQEGGKPEDAFIPKDFDILAPKFSITGKPTGKGVFSGANDDNKFNALDQSISFLSKNQQELPKLPDYNITKNTNSCFSFPRQLRFTEEMNVKFPGPNEYFKESDLERYERELKKNPNQLL